METDDEKWISYENNVRKKIWTKLAEISKMLTKPKRSGSIEMIMTIGIEKGIVQSLV